jgi:hypothetical protein
MMRSSGSAAFDIGSTPAGIAAAYAANWAVTDWYLDGAAGNDANNGTTALTPLRTGAELLRRLGTGRVQWTTSVIVHLLASITDGIAIAYQLNTGGTGFRLVGTPTILLAGTVATYTAAAGNIPRRMTAAGVADWTAYVGKRVRVLTGTGIGAIFWIAKVAPDGLGNDVCRISTPTLSNQSQAVLAPGDTFVVEDLPSLAWLWLDGWGSVGTAFTFGTGTLQIESVKSNETELRSYGFQTTLAPILWASELLKRVSSLPLTEQAGLVIMGCKLAITTIPCALSFGNMYVPSASGTTLYNERFVATGSDLFQGVRLNFQTGFINCSSTTYIMDSPAVGLVVGPRCVVATSSAISGSGNATFGVEFYPGARWTYRVALPPTLTGTSGDISLRAPVSVTLPWSGIPWNDGARSGHAVPLVPGGAKVVTVPYMLTTQAILLTINTPSGVGSPGILTAPDAARTNTQFSVYSPHIAADAATFDWSIAPLGYNQIIAPQQA